MNAAREQRFIPALRFSALTPLFDPVVRMTTRERTFKRRLLERAAVRAGEEVLDLGAGTGTLALMLEHAEPRAVVTGLDADREILSQARAKAVAAGSAATFVEAFSDDMPFEDESFDVIVSTLFFHHLDGGVKRATLRECVRVLRRGGRLVVGDWGRPADPLMAALFLQVRAIDGFGVTADNAHGRLPALFEEAGLDPVHTTDELRTPLGTIALYTGARPQP
jgi:ubiquinone/menaquinone biosynthesis C-methylase UbiE